MAFTEKEKELSYIASYQKEKYDRITVMADKGKKELYKDCAKVKGLSLSAFVMDCVEKEIERMKK